MMKRIVPLALIAFGILLSVAAFGQVYRTNQDPVSKPGILPTQIAGLELTSTKTGDAAISEFTNMHGKKFL